MFAQKVQLARAESDDHAHAAPGTPPCVHPALPPCTRRRARRTASSSSMLPSIHVSPGIAYSPLPPIIPISTFSKANLLLQKLRTWPTVPAPAPKPKVYRSTVAGLQQPQPRKLPAPAVPQARMHDRNSRRPSSSARSPALSRNMLAQRPSRRQRIPFRHKDVYRRQTISSTSPSACREHLLLPIRSHPSSVPSAPSYLRPSSACIHLGKLRARRPPATSTVTDKPVRSKPRSPSPSPDALFFCAA